MPTPDLRESEQEYTFEEAVTRDPTIIETIWKAAGRATSSNRDPNAQEVVAGQVTVESVKDKQSTALVEEWHPIVTIRAQRKAARYNNNPRERDRVADGSNTIRQHAVDSAEEFRSLIDLIEEQVEELDAEERWFLSEVRRIVSIVTTVDYLLWDEQSARELDEYLAENISLAEHPNKDEPGFDKDARLSVRKVQLLRQSIGRKLRTWRDRRRG